MKRTLPLLLAGSLSIAAPSAIAGGHGHGWGWGHGYYPYWGGYHHHHHGGDDAAWLLGGLVVGGLFTSAYYNSRPVPAYSVAYPAYPTVVYRQPAYVPAPVVVTPGRRLLRDIEGRCYELSVDADGNELRTELAASSCNW